MEFVIFVAVVISYLGIGWAAAGLEVRSSKYYMDTDDIVVSILLWPLTLMVHSLEALGRAIDASVAPFRRHDDE